MPECLTRATDAIHRGGPIGGGRGRRREDRAAGER